MKSTTLEVLNTQKKILEEQRLGRLIFCQVLPRQEQEEQNTLLLPPLQRATHPSAPPTLALLQKPTQLSNAGRQAQHLQPQKTF